MSGGAPRGMVRVGDRVRFAGQVHTVVGLAGTAVRLADQYGAPSLVLFSHLLASEGFELLDSRPDAVPIAAFGLLDTVPQPMLARARLLERHLVEAQTGRAPDAEPGAAPRPKYDPQWHTLTERLQAKAAELTALGVPVSYRSIQRYHVGWREQGLWGLVDKRATRTGSGTRADERLVTVVSELLAAQETISTGTRGRIARQAEALLAERFGPGAVPIPSKATMYRLITALSEGGYAFGPATTRRSQARKPPGPYTVSAADRPGQIVQIDSTPLDVLAILDDGVTGRPELTIAIDVATRTICAAVLRPAGTKAVDAALLLARMLLPKPMRPGWAEALRMSASLIPHARLMSIDARLEHAAAKPVVIPETGCTASWAAPCPASDAGSSVIRPRVRVVARLRRQVCSGESCPRSSRDKGRCRSGRLCSETRGGHDVVVNFAGQSALFTVTVRPARAAYLIADGSRDGLRRAVQEATARWGGQTELIIPVLDDGTITPYYRQVTEVANVDGLVSVDVPIDHARTLGRSFDMSVTPIDHIDGDGVTRYTSHPADLALPATVDGSNGYVIAAPGASLWQVTAAGDLSTEAEKGFHDGGMVVRRALFDHEIGESQLWGHTLLGATTVSVVEQWVPQAPLHLPTAIFLVSEDDDFSDCLRFWNLRALRSMGHFGQLPMYLLPADIRHWTAWPHVLFGALQRPDQFSPDVMITSLCVEKEVLHAFARSMDLQLSEDGLVRRSMKLGKQVPKRSAPFTYLHGFTTSNTELNPRYGRTESVDVPVVGEKTVLRFASPVPTKLDFGGWSLVGISGDPVDILPQRDPVAKLVTDKAYWHDGAVQFPDRIERNWRIELRIPTLATAYEAVMRELTSSHRLSDKGAMGVGLLEKAAMDVLAEPHVFEAIRQLTTPRGEEIARKLQKLFGKNQPLTEEQTAFAKEFGGRSERVFKSAERLGYGSFETAQTALERLAAIGWAERGFQTACSECKIKSFVPFSQEASRGSARCPVCGASADYTREPDSRGLVVHYRLDARVDFANDNGVIAHLMVIGALTRRYRHTFLKPGIDLFFADGTQGEADILGICDSKLVSGEVKMSGRSFTESQLKKYMDIIKRLHSDVYVMAATSPIEDTVKVRAKALCDELGVELLILERQGLLH